LEQVGCLSINVNNVVHLVASKGGFEMVQQDKKWSEIARELGIDPKKHSKISGDLRAVFLAHSAPSHQSEEVSASPKSKVIKASRRRDSVPYPRSIAKLAAGDEVECHVRRDDDRWVRGRVSEVDCVKGSFHAEIMEGMINSQTIERWLLKDEEKTWRRFGQEVDSDARGLTRADDDAQRDVAMVGYFVSDVDWTF
jgi:hypothetical protein